MGTLRSTLPQTRDPASAACLTARAALGPYVRVGLPPRESMRVAAHLECCRACAASYLELVDIRRSPRRVRYRP